MNILADIFLPEPETWGLRGDPCLWEAMREHFKSAPLPTKSEDLSGLIAEAFEYLAEKPFDTADHFFIEKYAHGGMSSGHVDPTWWREDALRLLRDRLDRALKENQ